MIEGRRFLARSEALAGEIVVALVLGGIEQPAPLLPHELGRALPLIELLHPLRQLGAVVVARDEIAARRFPPVRAGRLLARGENRAAVLHGNADDLGAVMQPHLVGEIAPDEIARRHLAGRRRGADAGGRGIADAINHLVRALVVPVIRDDPVDRRRRAAEEARVPGSGDGRDVIVAREGHERAMVRQHAKAVRAELIMEALQVVVTHLVDENRDHELRPGRRRGEAGGGEETEEEQGAEKHTKRSECMAAKGTKGIKKRGQASLARGLTKGSTGVPPSRRRGASHSPTMWSRAAWSAGRDARRNRRGRLCYPRLRPSTANPGQTARADDKNRWPRARSASAGAP